MGRAVSVVEFFEKYSREDNCLGQIFDSKWGGHSPCPKCGIVDGWTPIKGTKKYLHRCRSHLSPLKGTPFYRSNLSLMACFYAMLLFANSSSGVRSSFVRKQLGIGIKSAHRLCNRIRLHMSSYDRPEMLGGPEKKVYVDEVYLRHVRCPNSSSLVAKIVLGFCCDGHVLCGIVENRKAATLLSAIDRMVAPGSIIVTDDWVGYKRVPTLGFDHITINHSTGRFFDYDGNSTCEIDSYWATMRRALRLYHQVAEDNLWLYLAEIEFRYNHRFAATSTFDALVSHWPDLDDLGAEALRRRYDWTGVAG